MTSAARRALVALGLLAAAALPLAVPAVREGVGTAVGLLLAGDTEGLRSYLRSFGLWAPVLSALLMVGQAVAAPLPAFVVTLANGLLFGAFWGGLLSWSSAMAGAALCFWLSRAFGRPLAERLAGRTALEAADRFFARHGVQAILAARLLPFVPFDPVSYAAGLTRMSLARFLLATGLGQLPATALYSYAGERASGAARLLLWVFGATAGIALIGRLVRGRRTPTRALRPPAAAADGPGRPQSPVTPGRWP